MSNLGTANLNPAIPTAAQLAESRTKQWHQQGEALLTIENLRSFINAAGLVLYAPRPQIASPAPSLVEAVLGAANSGATLEQTSEARSLLSRLIAEGLAVPLNLLGAANGAVGETPDFVASTAVFSYVFTLRGDKAWKQPPATSGPLKVSNLALAAHEALARRGPLTAYDLTTELGKEVTEAAVLRALAELWTHLRVLPLPQPDGKPAIWELASVRFTKQIKAGANAGQPSALSALISLYLGQAIVASEDEIEGFLSPLASRSRIRDVMHALLSARQLDTVAVEGRTMLHVAGELPAFLAPEPVATAVKVEITALGNEGVADESGEAPSRITKYVPKPRKVGTGYLAKAKPAKFAPKPDGAGFGSRTGFKSTFQGGAAGGFKPRSGPAPDRERRPFAKSTAAKAGRGFDKPWEEEKARRLSAAAKPSGRGEAAASDAAVDVPRAPRVYKPRAEAGTERRVKPSFGAKPSFSGKPSFGSNPSFSKEGRPPRRDFAASTDGDAGEARPPRKTFSKPGTFARKREGFGSKPAFGGEGRPPRRDFAPRPDRGERPPFSGSRSSGSYSPKPRGDRPQGDRPVRAEGAGFAPRKSFGSRASGGSGFAEKSSFGGKPAFGKDRPASRSREDRGSSTETGKRVYRKFDAPRGERTSSGERPARSEGTKSFARKPAGDFAPRKFAGKSSGKPGGFGGKSAGKPGGSFKKPFSKTGGGFAGKPASTFAKFSDGKKPFGKRPPARKFKPKEDSAS